MTETMTELITMAEGFERPLPVVTEQNAFYWRAGADGVLRFKRCNSCEALLHPPVPVCRYCRSDDIGIGEVSGRGVIVGVTVNYQAWDPRFPPPFVIATVAIEEDPRVRVLSNLVDVDPSEIKIGMPVTVDFRPTRHDGVVPVFRPTGLVDG